MPPNADRGPASGPGDDLERWQQRNRSASASAWLYHVGLDAFAAGEHFRHGRRVAGTFALLLARDVGIFQAVLRKRGGTETTTRLSIVLAAITDVAAAALLRGHIPAGDFETDRALSQFGLSAGWALQLGSARRRRGDAVVSYAAPVAMQVALSTIWGLRRGRQLRYVGREAAWSLVALACVSRLSRTMREAVDNGFASAQSANAVTEMQSKARRQAHVAQHEHDILNTVKIAYARNSEAAAQRMGGKATLAALAELEDEYRRIAPEDGAVGVRALALHLLCARHADTDASLRREPDQRGVQLFTRHDDRDVLTWLLDAAASAEGELVVEMEVEDGSLVLALAADRFGALDPPEAVTLVSTNGSSRITAQLELQSGRP